MADELKYKNKQDMELTEADLFKDRSDNEKEALKFFCGIPVGGCIVKKYLTGDAYMALLEAKKGNVDYKQKAIKKLGIDEDMAKEIDPIFFEGFLFEFPKTDPFKQYHENKAYSSMWELTWLFFGEEQVYVYNYSFDTTDAITQERTQEYFYSDITAFTTESRSDVSKVWVTKGSGCSSSKEYKDKTTNFDIFKIVVPGESHKIAYPGTEEADQSVSAMKQKLRDMKRKND